MEYVDTLPVEAGKDEELLCKEMCFGDNEPGLASRSKLYQVAQKEGKPYSNFRKGYDASRLLDLYAIELFLKRIENKTTSLSVLDKVPDSIGRAVDWTWNFKSNVSWVRGDCWRGD